MMGPILKSLAQDWKDRLTVIKVNIDDKPHLAQRFEVSSVPTMVLFKNGQEIHRLSGAMPLMSLKSALQSFVQP
jgi:thioredoxin-like negative regulator of GroEL